MDLNFYDYSLIQRLQITFTRKELRVQKQKRVGGIRYFKKEVMAKVSELENKQYNIPNKIYFLILEKDTGNMKRVSNITSNTSKSVIYELAIQFCGSSPQ